MKTDKIEVPATHESRGELTALPIFDDATLAADRRDRQRDEPSRRKHRRVELNATVRLRGAGQGGVNAVIQNLSAGGCSLAICEGNFGEGDLVTVKITGVESWHGVLKWSANGEVGVAFDRPFYPAVFEAIVATHK